MVQASAHKTNGMEPANPNIEKHYHREGLYESIVSRLETMGIDLQHVTRADLSAVDEFHVRGAEVSKELAAETALNDASVLDVGCGIGGPCRMLAATFNCQVTGIDMSREFIRTAEKLSELAGLADRTNFLQADALNLPFNASLFDAVWTQHVQMNVRDKAKFYQETYRVLKSGGTFIYYDIFSAGAGKIDFPVPWAEDASISFLIEVPELKSLLERTGFKEVQVKNQTAKAMAFFQGLFKRLEKNGPPPLGLHLLMGENTGTKLRNLLHGIEEGQLVLQSGIYRKEQ